MARSLFPDHPSPCVSRSCRSSRSSALPPRRCMKSGASRSSARRSWRSFFCRYNISHAIVNPDGLFPRQVVGVNGTWPPPPLEANANDTVRVHVVSYARGPRGLTIQQYNGLSEPTAVHHHVCFFTDKAVHTHREQGIYFNGTGYYDGAPGITQCGIPPGESLTYDVPVDLQNGTYWCVRPLVCLADTLAGGTRMSA